MNIEVSQKMSITTKLIVLCCLVLFTMIGCKGGSDEKWAYDSGSALSFEYQEPRSFIEPLLYTSVYICSKFKDDECVKWKGPVSRIEAGSQSGGNKVHAVIELHKVCDIEGTMMYCFPDGLKLMGTATFANKIEREEWIIECKDGIFSDDTCVVYQVRRNLEQGV